MGVIQICTDTEAILSVVLTQTNIAVSRNSQDHGTRDQFWGLLLALLHTTVEDTGQIFKTPD